MRTGPPTRHAAPKANVEFFRDSVRALLLKSCLDCHGPENSEGRLRVDQLDPDLLIGADIDKWREVYNVLSNSEMPPEDETTYALKDADRGMIVDWLSAELKKASVARRNQQEHSSFRRLTKYEYNYALQDLLGLPYPLASKLPPESVSEDGFKNNSALLQMSAMQLETYREIGLKALKQATVTAIVRTGDLRHFDAQEMERVASNDKAKVFSKDGGNYAKDSRRQHLLNRERARAFTFQMEPGNQMVTR